MSVKQMLLCDAPEGRGGSWSQAGTIIVAPRIARGGNEALGSVYTGSLDGAGPRQILTAASNVAFSDGYLFYVKVGTLTIQRFDATGLRLQGKPISIAANIEYYNPRDLGYFSDSRNLLVYRTAAVQSRDLAWFDLTGKGLEHWGEPATTVAAVLPRAVRWLLFSGRTPTGAATASGYRTRSARRCPV